MSINFLPLRAQMTAEIEQCIKLSRLDTLLSFCNSCIYGFHEASECWTCGIRHGALKIAGKSSKRTVREPVEGEELLGIG